MNQVWIIGRFSLILIVATGVFVTMGCQQPLSVLRMILPIHSQDDDESVSPAGYSDDDNGPKPKAEELVADWEKPTFALFVTGRQHGYIEPCGCTGLANQKGGLMRRHTCQKILKDLRGWDLVSLDAGNQVRRFGQQPTIKLSRTYESLCKVMNYDMIGLGADDLKIPSINLAQEMLNAPDGETPFTCANVEVVDGSLSNKFMVIEKNGKRIGVTMVLGNEHVAEFEQSDDLTVVAAEAGLAQAVPQLQAANCDLKVLIAHTSLENCRELAKKFPVFNILITAGGAGDPALHPEVIKVDSVSGKTTSMIQVGVKGMYVGIIGYYENEGQPSIKYERVPLDERFKDSPEMQDVFKAYQADLKQLWITGELADIKPRLHPSGFSFVGSESCADCHDREFEIWEDGVDGDGGPHAHATVSLTNPGERTWVQRHYDPECVSCHVSGWNPQLYYPYESGFMDIDKDTHLFANGCENCHGPGSGHIDAENNHADNDELVKSMREEMRLTVEQARAKACFQCHDLDNSPEYVKEGGFDKYWPRIEH